MTRHPRPTRPAFFVSLVQMLDGDLEAFVSKVSWELSNSRNKSIKVIVSPLALLLKSEKARLAFGQHGGVGYLTKLLKLQGSHGNAQLLYELTFCIWTLTFHEELKQGESSRVEYVGPLTRPTRMQSNQIHVHGKPAQTLARAEVMSQLLLRCNNTRRYAYNRLHRQRHGARAGRAGVDGAAREGDPCGAGGAAQPVLRPARHAQRRDDLVRTPQDARESARPQVVSARARSRWHIFVFLHRRFVRIALPCLPSCHRTNRSDQELKADLDYLHDALQKDARDLR